MKKIFLFAAAALLALCTLSCTKDSFKESQLLGWWKCTYATADGMPMELGERFLAFFDDGSMNLPYTWSKKGNKVTLTSLYEPVEVLTSAGAAPAKSVKQVIVFTIKTLNSKALEWEGTDGDTKFVEKYTKSSEKEYEEAIVELT